MQNTDDEAAVGTGKSGDGVRSPDVKSQASLTTTNEGKTRRRRDENNREGETRARLPHLFDDGRLAPYTLHARPAETQQKRMSLNPARLAVLVAVLSPPLPPSPTRTRQQAPVCPMCSSRKRFENGGRR